MEQAIVREKVELKVSDGTRMFVYVARPQDAGPHSAVIVLQGPSGSTPTFEM
jgi:dienelactone hydrolase